MKRCKNCLERLMRSEYNSYYYHVGDDGDIRGQGNTLWLACARDLFAATGRRYLPEEVDVYEAKE